MVTLLITNNTVTRKCGKNDIKWAENSKLHFVNLPFQFRSHGAEIANYDSGGSTKYRYGSFGSTGSGSNPLPA